MRAFGIILALALTTGASAQGRLPDIAYNGVSAGYTRTDLEGTSQDADSLLVGRHLRGERPLPRVGLNRPHDVRGDHRLRGDLSRPTSATCRSLDRTSRS